MIRRHVQNPSPASDMATYSKEDFERIAAAIGKDTADVVKHEKLFDRGVFWFRLDCGSPFPKPKRSRRTPPSQMRTKMQQIAKSARRLLKDLGVHNTEDAYDGPGNLELLEVLAWAANYDENSVVTATRRIGRLTEILEAIEAANDFEHWGCLAADEVIKFGQLTVPKEHQGDVAVNNWLALMMEAYREITGSEPATSVGAIEQPNEGIASGPFIRFLAAAGQPIGIEYSEDAWRSRVRTIQKQSQKRTKNPKRKI